MSRLVQDLLWDVLTSVNMTTASASRDVIVCGESVTVMRTISVMSATLHRVSDVHSSERLYSRVVTFGVVDFDLRYGVSILDRAFFSSIFSSRKLWARTFMEYNRYWPGLLWTPESLGERFHTHDIADNNEPWSRSHELGKDMNKMWESRTHRSGKFLTPHIASRAWIRTRIDIEAQWTLPMAKTVRIA